MLTTLVPMDDVSGRLGVAAAAAKMARSWEKEILGLISSVDASSSVGAVSCRE
jgi:hypothetical protein